VNGENSWRRPHVQANQLARVMNELIAGRNREYCSAAAGG